MGEQDKLDFFFSLLQMTSHRESQIAKTQKEGERERMHRLTGNNKEQLVIGENGETKEERNLRN